MKYIRDENKICKVNITEGFAYWENNQKHTLRLSEEGLYENFKVANTIEELCDEFVEVSKKGYFKPFLAENRFELFDNYTKEQIYSSSILYGAIWTDKGLIYVAKMNKKGKLELL